MAWGTSCASRDLPHARRRRHRASSSPPRSSSRAASPTRRRATRSSGSADSSLHQALRADLPARASSSRRCVHSSATPTCSRRIVRATAQGGRLGGRRASSDRRHDRGRGEGQGSACSTGTVTTDNGYALRELIHPIPAGHLHRPRQRPAPGPAPPPRRPRARRAVRQGSWIAAARRCGEDLLILAALGVARRRALRLARGARRPRARSPTPPARSRTSPRRLDVSHRVDEGTDDELGRLRRAFNQLLEEVERSQASQRQLILDASHELRTPLTSLRANAQVLGRIRELDDERRDPALRRHGHPGGRADPASWATSPSSPRASTPSRRPTTFDLADLVERVRRGRRDPRAHQAGSPSSSEPAPCPVEGRRNRLARAVGNLLDNAIKFSPGARAPWPSTAGRRVVTVEDDGPGIDEPDRPHVFDRSTARPGTRPSRARDLASPSSPRSPPRPAARSRSAAARRSAARRSCCGSRSRRVTASHPVSYATTTRCLSPHGQRCRCGRSPPRAASPRSHLERAAPPRRPPCVRHVAGPQLHPGGRRGRTAHRWCPPRARRKHRCPPRGVPSPCGAPRRTARCDGHLDWPACGRHPIARRRPVTCHVALTETCTCSAGRSARRRPRR